MRAHGVISRDGAVNEGPALLALVQGASFLKSFDLLPPLQDLPLLSYEINLSWYVFEHASPPLNNGLELVRHVKFIVFYSHLELFPSGVRIDKAPTRHYNMHSMHNGKGVTWLS